MTEEIKTINKIIEILDTVEQGHDSYDEFDAYGDICKIIDKYQQNKIDKLSADSSTKNNADITQTQKKQIYEFLNHMSKGFPINCFLRKRLRKKE